MPSDTTNIARPRHVQNAVLGPLLPPVPAGRVECVASTPGFKLEHIRSDESGAIDMLDIIPITLAEAGNLMVVEQTTVYAGPYFNHFGHFMAEGIHRLWAASLPDLREAPVVFQTLIGTKLESWAYDVLRMCAVDPERVIMVDQPTLFRNLVVPLQGRGLKTGDLIPGYVSLFPLTYLPVPSRDARKIYVSRSRHIHSGSFLGESLIERLLENAGFRIVHPQEIPLEDLVGLLSGAEQLIFAEGSGIHNLELCGPVNARVLVIGRRRGSERHYRPLLNAICSDWTIFPGERATVCLDWEKESGNLRRGRGCSLIAMPQLIDCLSNFTGSVVPAPSEEEVFAAVSQDLIRFLLDPKSGANSNDAELGRALRLMREDPEVLALLAAIST